METKARNDAEIKKLKTLLVEQEKNMKSKIDEIVNKVI